MAVFQSLQEAQDFFKDDKFATENGITIEELSEEKCITKLKVTDHHRNAVGGVMGGAIFTLADLAFSAHCNHLHKPTVGLQNNITYMSGAKGDVLYATSKCLKDGRTTGFYEVEITDNTGRLLATMSCTGFKL